MDDEPDTPRLSQGDPAGQHDAAERDNEQDVGGTGDAGDTGKAESGPADATLAAAAVGRPHHALPGRLARQRSRRRRREQLAGALIAVLGVAVLVVAIVALRNPKRPAAAPGTITQRTSASAGARSGTAPKRSRSGHRSASTAPSHTRSSQSTSSTPTGSRSSFVGALPLIVLNDTTITGLAARAAQRFESGGWTVSLLGNLQNDILSTAAYYDPTVPNAKRTARALQRQYPTIKRVVPRFSQLPSGPIVVVLTPDYSPG
jgi:hypothetical protein